MKVCQNCGKVYSDDASFCEDCGAQLVSQGAQSGGGSQTFQNLADKGVDALKTMGKTVQEGVNQTKKYINEVNESRSQGFIKLTDSEVVIRNYHVVTVLFPSMNGYLMVTNKRLCFYGQAYGSKIYQETPIDSVGSLDTFYGFRFYISRIIIGIVLFVIYGYLQSTMGRFTPGVLNLLWLIGLACIALSFHRSLVITVKSNKANGAGIEYGSLKTFGAGAMLFSGRSAEDTDRMISELGALVLDLQQEGDLAVEKWVK